MAASGWLVCILDVAMGFLHTIGKTVIYEGVPKINVDGARVLTVDFWRPRLQCKIVRITVEREPG